MASTDEEKVVKENYGSTLNTVGAKIVLQIIIMQINGENLTDTDCGSELTLRVRDELVALYGSKGQAKKQFKFLRDFKKLDDGDAMNSFDLTLLSQLFEMIGGPKGEPQWEELKKLIHNLRDKRNDTAHSVGARNYTRMDVTDLFDDLISLCTKLIQTSGSYYSKDLNYITLLVDTKEKEISWRKERLIEHLNKNAADLVLYNVSTVKDESEKLGNVTKELQKHEGAILHQVKKHHDEISQTLQDQRDKIIQKDVEENKEKLEKITCSFLNWMKSKIRDLKDQSLPNSIEGINNLLYKLEEYKSEEKLPRERERYEINHLLIMINKKLTDLKQPIYVPKNSHQMHDIETKWEQLEEAENAREDALKEKLEILRDVYLLHNFGVKDMLTIVRSLVMGEKPQTTRESILHIISKIVMLDYNSRQLQLSFQCDESKIRSNKQKKFNVK